MAYDGEAVIDDGRDDIFVFDARRCERRGVT